MRFFFELSYRGSEYSGFQVQHNANTVQAEVEKAFSILQKEKVNLTGSSRTDAGVHALQNFFHADYNGDLHAHFIYKMNAILPRDIVIRNVYRVPDGAHCRFDATSRSYAYYIYRRKDPFLEDRAYYYPYRLDIGMLREAASVIREYEDFTSFCKRNTQVKTFRCRILESGWEEGEQGLVYRVRADRFLRGMVRALVSTMLQVGRKRIDIKGFREIILAKDCSRASFSVPARGLFLEKVEYGYELGEALDLGNSGPGTLRDAGEDR